MYTNAVIYHHTSYWSDNWYGRRVGRLVIVNIQDYGFPRLFTFISEHVCFLLFSFFLFYHFLDVGSVR